MLRTLLNTSPNGLDATDGVHLVYTGSGGLAAFSAQVAAEGDLPRFRAETVSTDYAGVTVARLRSTECRIDRGSQLTGYGSGFELALLLDGRIRLEQGGTVSEASAGDLYVTPQGVPSVIDSEAPFQLAWMHVPADRVPPRMLAPDALPRGPLAETRLSSSVGAFLRRLAAGPAVGHGPDRVYLARAVAELAVAVIAEAMGDDLPDDRSAALRMKVREHIEHHLGDPDLGPQQIATALGVSVRYVHRVFNVEGETVARFIREQRLEAVARLLRAERRPQRVGAVAARFGFSGRDHLTRAFRQRYGTTLREYQDAGGADPSSMLVSTRLRQGREQ